jgi:hypothetical protein
MTDAVHSKRSPAKSSQPTSSISGWRRFWIGGLGALLPLLVTLLAIDVSGLIDHHENLTLGIYVGTVIRYIVLFALGGIVAALNSDEEKPIRLVQLGIAAPALITSFVNLTPANTKSATDSPAPAAAAPHAGALFGFIGAAHAVELLRYAERIRAPIPRVNFLDDVVRGATNNITSAARANAAATEEARAAAERARAAAEAKAAAEAAARKSATRSIPPIVPPQQTAESPQDGLSISPNEKIGDPIVRRAQQYLIALGYKVTEVTGLKDGATSAAVMAFKDKHGLARDDYVDKLVLNAMKAALVSQTDPG